MPIYWQRFLFLKDLIFSDQLYNWTWAHTHTYTSTHTQTDTCARTHARSHTHIDFLENACHLMVLGNIKNHPYLRVKKFHRYKAFSLRNQKWPSRNNVRTLLCLFVHKCVWSVYKTMPNSDQMGRLRTFCTDWYRLEQCGKLLHSLS